MEIDLHFKECRGFVEVDGVKQDKVFLVEIENFVSSNKDENNQSVIKIHRFMTDEQGRFVLTESRDSIKTLTESYLPDKISISFSPSPKEED